MNGKNPNLQPHETWPRVLQQEVTTRHVWGQHEMCRSGIQARHPDWFLNAPDLRVPRKRAEMARSTQVEDHNSLLFDQAQNDMAMEDHAHSSIKLDVPKS